MDKKKNILIIFTIICLLVVISGTTYAIYTWAINNVIISGSLECFDIVYVKDGDIGSDDDSEMLTTSADYTGGLFAKVTVSIDSNCTIGGNGILYLNTDASTSSSLLSSGALKYQVIENSSSLVGDGVITSTGQIPIYQNISIDNTPKQLSVSVWLDCNLINESNQEGILTSIYKGSISMDIESGDLE